MTLTTEWLKERLKNPRTGTEFELINEVLANREAQTVYQFIYNNPYEEGYAEWVDCNKEYFNGVPKDCRRILYTATPAPAVPDEKPKLDYNPSMSWGDQCVANAEIRGWNACLAAMLAAAPDGGK